MKQKLDLNHRNHLIQIYLHMGPAEAQHMSLEYGMHCRYAEKQAFELGYGIRTNRRSNASIARTNPCIVDHDDPRWAWAIAVGPVVV